MFEKYIGKWKKITGHIESIVPNPKRSDIYLVSYPKSGNTWMRYLLAHALWPEIDKPDLVEMGRLIPSYGLQNDYKCMLDPDSPCNKLKHRIIKEHFPYNNVAKKYVKNVIYLCRDGRDAIISYWYFLNQVRGTDISLNDFIKESSSHPFGSWHDHVQQWITAPVNKIIIKYEDMLNNPATCLKRVLDFIGIERDESVINQAVERSSFTSMKNLEENKGFKLDMLKNVNFTRRGETGSWVDMFDDQTIKLFKQYHGAGINSLDYIW